MKKKHWSDNAPSRLKAFLVQTYVFPLPECTTATWRKMVRNYEQYLPDIDTITKDIRSGSISIKNTRRLGIITFQMLCTQLGIDPVDVAPTMQPSWKFNPFTGEPINHDNR